MCIRYIGDLWIIANKNAIAAFEADNLSISEYFCLKLGLYCSPIFIRILLILSFKQTTAIQDMLSCL